MTSIRTVCSDCGTVELMRRDVTVSICNDTDEASYAFRCPVCRRMVSKPIIESRTTDTLVSAGCPLRTWSLPLELKEDHIGDPITADDVINFHFDLQKEESFDWLREGSV